MKSLCDWTWPKIISQAPGRVATGVPILKSLCDWTWPQILDEDWNETQICGLLDALPGCAYHSALRGIILHFGPQFRDSTWRGQILHFQPLKFRFFVHGCSISIIVQNLMQNYTNGRDCQTCLSFHILGPNSAWHSQILHFQPLKFCIFVYVCSTSQRLYVGRQSVKQSQPLRQVWD